MPDGVLVAAIADGAGSASHSHVGATVATKTAVTYLADQALTPDVLGDEDSVRSLLMNTVIASQAAVTAAAETYTAELRDLATTLIIIVATPQMVAAVQIGDGVAVANDVNNNLIALTQPQSGEYINQTTFLISPEALASAEITVCYQAIANVAVLTDGLQMLALNMVEGKPYKPFFTPLFKFAAHPQDVTAAADQLVAFLSSERVTQRTDDDLTLLLAAVTRSVKDEG